jgi:deoxyribodipyrimidine photo-lyase
MRVLFWFRKDLRLDDNTGLVAAARDAGGDVVPFYASDPAILGRPDMAAARVRLVLESLGDLAGAVERAGSRLALAHGDPAGVVTRAARAAHADAVYWNDEYEPALRARDDAVAKALGEADIAVKRFHDRLLVPPGMVRNQAGDPFVVYTPFRRACEALPLAEPAPEVARFAAGHDLERREVATLAQLGFEEPHAARWPGGAAAAHQRLARFLEHGLARYDTERDLPGADAVSHLSADLKFGTISARTVAHAALEAARADRRLDAAAAKFIAELRWRDFYAHVLYHFPHCETGSFRREYDALRWQGDPRWLAAWKDGLTGYPMVDAGMRELAATGFMHNRARMIVASFLTKDLLLDWRQGERHFMNRLIDGDLASNNGGWQWAAGTGTDAQPHFRIFNPWLQGEKFDPGGAYVRRWVPELANAPGRYVHRPWEAPPLERALWGADYPERIVVHEDQREKALAMYAAVKSAG